jgi:hypothetical protein
MDGNIIDSEITTGTPDCAFYTCLYDGRRESTDPAAICPGNTSGEYLGGVGRRGIFVHPPDNGRTIVDFIKTQPLQPALFQCVAGIRDGSVSEGIICVVRFICQTVIRNGIVILHHVVNIIILLLFFI